MKERHGWKPLPIKGSPLVSMVIATYQQGDELACLLYSLRAQTYPNWEALVIHDGPKAEWRKEWEKISIPFDPRIKLIDTPVHEGRWGHPHRQWGISQARGEYICLSNGDNYYVPVFFEWMLYEMQKGADFVHCYMVHSHKRYADFHTIPLKTKIDLGAWMGHHSIVKSTPWTDYGFAGDGTFIEAVAGKAKKISCIPAFLFVHN